MKTSGRKGYCRYMRSEVDAIVAIVALNMEKNPMNGWDLTTWYEEQANMQKTTRTKEVHGIQGIRSSPFRSISLARLFEEDQRIVEFFSSYCGIAVRKTSIHLKVSVLN